VIAARAADPDGNQTPRGSRRPGARIGHRDRTLHGMIITKIGIPSFVVTLAG